MLDIVQYIPGKRKQTTSGWISFNAPCCIHNGDSQDRRMRGGLKVNTDGWSYHCFNCNFTASFVLGRNLSVKARKLLNWLGVPSEEIERVNLESLRHRSMEGLLNDRKQLLDAMVGINFEQQDLPEASILLDNDTHSDIIDYLKLRQVPLDYPFMTLEHYDGVAWYDRPHIIIPFTYNNVIVGHTKRFLDNKTPKYINDMQPGYVFGTDLQKSNWQHVIVTEGIFDALCIGGLAVMHSTVNDAQARLIRSLGREITVVPDQDRAGMELVDRAIELGWAVSMPAWKGCKDVNDAVVKYGRLGTLLTIMQARETSKIKIELRKRQIVKAIS